MRHHGDRDVADASNRIRLGQAEIEVYRGLIRRVVQARARQEYVAATDISKVRRIDDPSAEFSTWFLDCSSVIGAASPSVPTLALFAVSTTTKPIPKTSDITGAASSNARAAEDRSQSSFTPLMGVKVRCRSASTRRWTNRFIAWVLRASAGEETISASPPLISAPAATVVETIQTVTLKGQSCHRSL